MASVFQMESRPSVRTVWAPGLGAARFVEVMARSRSVSEGEVIIEVMGWERECGDRPALSAAGGHPIRRAA
jgi:hypothetical protein